MSGAAASLLADPFEAAKPLNEEALDALAGRMVDLLAPRVADLVAERLASQAAGTTDDGRRLVDAATLASELCVARAWVYEHREELGVVELGNGPKPRLRFDLEVARAATARLEGNLSDGQNTSARARTSHTQDRRRSRTPNHAPKAGSVLVVRPRGSSSGSETRR